MYATDEEWCDALDELRQARLDDLHDEYMYGLESVQPDRLPTEE